MILNWDCLYCLYQRQDEGTLSLYRSPSDTEIERRVSVVPNWVERRSRFLLTADNKQQDMFQIHVRFCVHAAAICLDNVSRPMGLKQEVRVSQTYAPTIYCVSILIMLQHKIYNVLVEKETYFRIKERRTFLNNCRNGSKIKTDNCFCKRYCTH